MKANLYPFQKKAVSSLRAQTFLALNEYKKDPDVPQIISFTAPTGAGKTVILAALMETIFCGSAEAMAVPDAIFVWLSDSPELNLQSKMKIESMADELHAGQCQVIESESFDRDILEEGHIYFLNTQKLGSGSNLTKHSGGRQYTIWETLANTVRDKGGRLIFIIDEAHRGAKDKAAAKATTIMQKFIKGSPDDDLPPMPLVIGATATPERFNRLVEGIFRTVRYVTVKTDEVRASGLLKDRIVLSYPEEQTVNKDMAVLQAAADDWKMKWEHWNQYCVEQHYTQVYPIFLIQVQNVAGDNVTGTDLDDCLKKIEQRTGFTFQSGEVVHTFGEKTAKIHLNDIDVYYLEPSKISEDRKVKVVFFKENLSTGWDCPRAETMMSFRRANDATYIAQLLGRMIRTPLQMHVDVDDTLNDVHLYLPYFNAATVESVVTALQEEEGGDIPADIGGESIGSGEIWGLGGTTSTGSWYGTSFGGSTNTGSEGASGTQTESTGGSGYAVLGYIGGKGPTVTAGTGNNGQGSLFDPPITGGTGTGSGTGNLGGAGFGGTGIQTGNGGSSGIGSTNVPPVDTPPEPEIDRQAIVKYINKAGIFTYKLRSKQISNYLASMFRLAHLLVRTGLYPGVTKQIQLKIVAMVRAHVEKLQNEGTYDELVEDALAFRLKTRTFDPFGEILDYGYEGDFFSSTDTDLERQFNLAEKKLFSEGIGKAYGSQYYDAENPSAYMVDFILFVADEGCMANLYSVAEKTFHQLVDDYRKPVSSLVERDKKAFNDIVRDTDEESKTYFELPIRMEASPDAQGVECTDHLYVNNNGIAKIALNGWEAGLLEEERKRADFICWYRNPVKRSWSLSIPYSQGNERKLMYPDFIVIRSDGPDEYFIDILEPHDDSRKDNLGKAKGLADYAAENPMVGRIQLIRKAKDATGKDKFIKLDMGQSQVRNKVQQAMTNDEIDHLFDTYGI